MVDSILFDGAVDALRSAMNISSERNRLLTSNIANVDTVGYRPSDVDFKKALDQALDRSEAPPLAHTHGTHFSRGAGDGDLLAGARVQEDQPVVDIDQQMTRLAENNLQYRTQSEMLLRKLSLIKYSITEGGR